MLYACPKPKKSRRKYLDDDGVYRFPCGREVCNLKSKNGMAEYTRRVDQMHTDQGGKCGLQIAPQCKAVGGKLSREFAQFGHPRSRKFGSGARDDRLFFPDGRPTGAKALCPWCNSLQSSRPITDFIVDDFVP
jgi:hypothetical protein